MQNIPALVYPPIRRFVETLDDKNNASLTTGGVNFPVPVHGPIGRVELHNATTGPVPVGR